MKSKKNARNCESEKHDQGNSVLAIPGFHLILSIKAFKAFLPSRLHIIFLKALGCFLSSRLVYTTLTLSLIGGALFFRLELPQQPFIDGDVGGYLIPALLQLTHGNFQHLGGRSFVYPGFIYLILLVFKDFRAITLIQHLMGVASGGVLLACWNCARTLMRDQIIPIGIYRLAGLLVAALYLFNTTAVRFEHSVRPEAIFPLFAGLNMLFNVQYIRHRYLEVDYRACFLYGSTNLFNASLLFFLKPSFYLGVAFSTLPIWVSLFDQKEPFNRKFAMMAISVLCIALFLFLPERSFNHRDDLGRTFLPTTLFVVHADIIGDQISTDLRDGAKTPYPRKLLEQTGALLTREIELSKRTGRYTSLGFDPDYLMYEDSFAQKFGTLLGPRETRENKIRFYYYYFFRAWTYQPSRMLRKVLRQISILYNNIGKASPYKRDVELVLGQNYLSNCAILDADRILSRIHYAPLETFISKSKELKSAEPRLLQPRAVSWMNAALGRTFSVSILLTFVTLVVALKYSFLRYKYGFFAATVMLLYTYSFANSLGIAIIHSLDIARFLTNQLIFCLLPQCMTMFLTAEILMDWSQYQRWREAKNSTS